MIRLPAVLDNFIQNRDNQLFLHSIYIISNILQGCQG